MRVDANNVWARLTSCTPDEELWLARYLLVPPAGAEEGEPGAWNRPANLYDPVNRRFPSGVLRLARDAARQQGIDLRVNDVRTQPHKGVNWVLPEWLRNYQQAAVAVALKRGRGIISMPTGGGKTECVAAIVDAVDVRWLILVDTRDLMHQMADRIELRTGERCGLAGDGEWDVRRITVATLQTLHRGIGTEKVDRLLEDAQGIVSDEVQVIAAREFNRVAMACANAWWRLGVSATPLERMDGQDFMAVAALGPLIHDVSTRELIDGGWLADAEINMHEFQHEKMTGSFAEIYEAGVILSEPRNLLVMSLAANPAASPPPTLVFFRALAHGRRLLKLITPLASVDMVDGGSNTRRRDNARKRLKSGRLDVLLTSKIFNKGIDIPDVLSGVNAAGGASSTDAIQKLGRGLRIPAGSSKQIFRYHDVFDLGHPTLERHARMRIAAYQSRGFKVKVIDARAQNLLPRS